MNSIDIIGNLVRDPESRTTPNGDTICTFTVASDRRFMTNGEKVTDFFRVNVWRKLGETCQKWLAKGKKVWVRGELQARQYDTKDGETRMSLDIDADRVEFLSPRGENDQPNNDHKPAATTSGLADQTSDDDELPF